jgi:hypothetical protein
MNHWGVSTELRDYARERLGASSVVHGSHFQSDVDIFQYTVVRMPFASISCSCLLI